MLYHDLVRFEPVEMIVQLRRADQHSEAQNLVSTYVVSTRMAEVLHDVIIPHLRFDQPFDNKGLLIVGNYGSGKSHLMSVLSAIAQWPELCAHLQYPDVANTLHPVAGRFQVLRMEVGATKMPLRDIVLKEQLEPFISRLGISFEFPSMSDTSNTKDPLLAMLNLFHEQYPEHGLLIIVDELLDYLRGRKDQELILDLSFLREIGEVCRLGRFRFIAGVQEALFDSPRFQFAADAMRRVRDRFEQVRITREDIAYVVAERLLRKTPEQLATVREHLRQFTPYYGKMAERLDEYMHLFPIHPAYLEVFERISFAENRAALKAISQTMHRLLDVTVPADGPGLISYDAYWSLLAEDPTYRTSPEIREVLKVQEVLQDRVAHAYTRPQYQALAQRLVDALSVLRLTTGDIYAPVGATPEELRDGLALFDPNLPEADADFLRVTTETALRELYRTMSGQFISVAENGQYYLDLKKTTDYDAEIEKRAEALDDETLNRYYYEALREALGQEPATYVPGFLIWEYEIPWQEKRVMRPGYLFFGTPRQRSTAQPPRDFYLYFLQPFGIPEISPEEQLEVDEVFFSLVHRDVVFDQAVKTFAGAREMALSTSGADQQTYFAKAETAKDAVKKWLHNHADAILVAHQGESRPLLQWERHGLGLGADAQFRDIVQGVAAGCLTPYFEEQYPQYPAFMALRQPITRLNRPKMVQDALRTIARQRTQSGVAILDGLELLDGEAIRPQHSRYAHYVLALLEQKRPGEVLNRHELIEPWMGTERVRELGIEPEYLVVIILALVHAGEVEVTLPGRKISVADLDDAARLPLGDWLNFRHLSRPKDLPLGAWIATFELLGLAPGLIQNADARDTAIDALQDAAAMVLERVLKVRERVKSGLLLWGGAVLEGADLDATLARLDTYKYFLETLRPFNTPGKLRNYTLSSDEVREQLSRRDLVDELTMLADQIGELQPLTLYLREAASLMPETNLFVERVHETQERHLAQLRDPQQRRRPTTLARVRQELEALKHDYIEIYGELHRQARLSQVQDQRKAALLRNTHLRQLEILAEAVPLLPAQRITELKGALLQLTACWRFIPADLMHEPRCPHCHFRPIDHAKIPMAEDALNKQEDALERLRQACIQTLQDGLQTPTAQSSWELLAPAERTRLEQLRCTGELPAVIDASFLRGLNLALQGLERITIPLEEILTALMGSGAPVSPAELQERFRQFLISQIADKNSEQVRIVIEW
ncbi:MAG: ATP-binding protein [Anaerolineae bacterium]|nr:ATP-binding protein [Anaerolineae bacterium]